jgi:hypothetical protein
MQLQPIAAALATAALLILSPAFGGTEDGGLGMGSFQSSCIPEARKCLEKLEALRYSNDPAHSSLGTQEALLGLLDTDPHCAMVLWGTVLP